ncbi:hypothetical protein EH165_14625 [Nakamurella antarctica]|uniref:Serine aminopeptidase S33 domain-containing protein n=1 Tax=Nakamurella antarctica TaxID=1902245 RepID=A0A3G9A084_9ACTN|nr:hypothetical protein EH165_14625 [Nakamurella antarctica]
MGTGTQALVLSALGISAGAGLEDLAEMVAAGIDPLTLGADPITMSRNAEHAAFVRADPLTWQQGIRRETLAALTSSRATLASAAAALTIPILLVHGERDSLSGVEGVRELANIHPSVTLVEFPEDLHNVIHEHDRDRVEACILNFLSNTFEDLS